MRGTTATFYSAYETYNEGDKITDGNRDVWSCKEDGVTGIFNPAKWQKVTDENHFIRWMTSDNIHELLSIGCDVISHALTQNRQLSEVQYEEQVEELRKNRDYIAQIADIRSAYICTYPMGLTNSNDFIKENDVNTVYDRADLIKEAAKDAVRINSQGGYVF